jgi:hypothetical protein
MLWSFPVVVQRASVLRLIGTLAAAKIAAASDRLIQSDATRGTPQEPAEELDPLGGRAFAGALLPSALAGFAAGLLSCAALGEPASADEEPAVAASFLAVAVSELSVDVLLAEPLSDVSAGAESAASAFFMSELRASRLAQPLPLKTIDGVEIIFFRGPPQTSQVVGPGLLIPWMTSVRRPHDWHAYS